MSVLYDDGSKKRGDEDAAILFLRDILAAGPVPKILGPHTKMKIRSGHKGIQLIGCLFALITLYYAVQYRLPLLGFIGVAVLFYDGLLVLFEPQCVCGVRDERVLP